MSYFYKFSMVQFIVCYSLAKVFSFHILLKKIEFCIRAQSCHEDDEHHIRLERTNHPHQRLAEACQFVHNDAKFVNERARNDIVLLSR